MGERWEDRVKYGHTFEATGVVIINPTCTWSISSALMMMMAPLHPAHFVLTYIAVKKMRHDDKRVSRGEVSPHSLKLSTCYYIFTEKASKTSQQRYLNRLILVVSLPKKLKKREHT